MTEQDIAQMDIKEGFVVIVIQDQQFSAYMEASHPGRSFEYGSDKNDYQEP